MRIPGDIPVQDVTLAFEDNQLASRVFGQYDETLAQIEHRLGLKLHANGNLVTLRGPPAAIDQGRAILEALYKRAHPRHAFSPHEIESVMEETLAHQDPTRSFSPHLHHVFGHIKTRHRGNVKARNIVQDRYIREMETKELVFAQGPAGTGKTWLAVGFAVSLLERGEVARLILTRPAVEAGEHLGFLPGDLREKVDPYLRPIYDALHDFMDPRLLEQNLQTGVIEIAPLAYMRGRTLSHACILLDEAQNTSPTQMKMFLTRLGERSRMIITGDLSQIDLPPSHRSGMKDAMETLQAMEEIGFLTFHQKDVIRSDLVRRIVGAYETRHPPSRSRPHLKDFPT